MTDKAQESYTLPIPTCEAPFSAPVPSPDTATDAPISVVAPMDIVARMSFVPRGTTSATAGAADTHAI